MPVKTPRRALAATAVAAVAAASTLFLGVGAASALPTGFTNPVGTVVPSTVGSTLTLTQTTDVAVVNFNTVSLALGETLDIVQDEGDILIIRNIGMVPAAFEGTMTADATVIITSPPGMGVAPSGSLRAGQDLILTTGAITDAGALLSTIPIDPAATDGIIGTDVGASLTAGGSVGVAGNYVFHQGSIDAFDGFAMLYSVDTTGYSPATVPRLSVSGTGLSGGGVAMTGSVYANGPAFVLAPAPGGMDVSGVMVSNGQGFIGSAADLLIGTGSSDGLIAQSYGNIDDAVGAQFPASVIVGTTDLELFWDYLGVSAEGATAPTFAVFQASGLELGEGGYTFPSIEATCIVEEGERQATVELPGGAQLAALPLTPVGYDFNIPNQAPIPIGDVATIAFNEQVHTTVGGWDVLTVTAVHLVGIDVDVRIGVVSCALPAGAELAATGSTMDAAPVLVGAAVLLLGGVLLVLRRRRVAG